MKEKIRLCCIADDFTGASDIASFFSEDGLRTLVTNGIPNNFVEIEDADIVVIALKTRTLNVDEAVSESRKALEWALDKGCEKFYFKYCSTFDSTSKGNIGPVADMMMEKLGIRYTVVCPSLPVNGRTVRHGILYVNGTPLSESHMKNHPLTPMTNSDIRVLLGEQSKYPIILLDENAFQSGSDFKDLLREMDGKWEHFYIVPDYYFEEHGMRIVDYFEDLVLYTGGSGLATHLGKKMVAKSGIQQNRNQKYELSGPTLLIAGSCSTATLGQIERYISEGLPYIKIEPEMLVSGQQTIDTLWSIISECNNGPILVFSSDTPDNILKAQENVGVEISELIEGVVSELAKKAVDNGIGKVVVAGGETSGAVTRRLGYNVFSIGKSVAPGVPVMIPLDNKSMKLILKSGNFGSPEFFLKAINLMEES
ncbi:3-oxo-tetronate kinase [Youngiibacter multivorans]|uniref:3-oxo-tetronate kinase n=1 Tax=Youngiibacter multivorans TaxID=937251 RepID=A0ABS4G8B6_9CLOT|nr:3-oxo-tetronate kinase [Youngiibacter multivorans]MBP1920657.1 uncharacterized protein YgbK (DUF1537 family) [Youngiibacter multivorans]